MLCPSRGGFVSVVLAALSGCVLQAYNQDEPRRPPTEAPVTFSERYRMTVLEIPAETDTDGDGVIDNHLPEALELLDFAVPENGFGRVAFNERLAEHVTELRPVFFDVRISDVLALDVLGSVLDEDGVVRIDEDHPTTLPGTIDDAGGFDAGPGDLTLDVVMADGLPSVPLGLLETRAAGELRDAGFSSGPGVLHGTLFTLLSIDAIVQDLIDPSVPAEGWDLDRDGVPEPKPEVMGIVANLAELLGDSRLVDGSSAISGALAFEAERVE